MKIEKQVCTLEQAIKLKSLNIRQYPHNYYWYELHLNGVTSFQVFPLRVKGWAVDEENDMVVRAVGDEVPNKAFAAFTVAELGIALGYGVSCKPTTTNEAIYRASCLIQDLENFVYTAEQVNQRLKAA